METIIPNSGLFDGPTPRKPGEVVYYGTRIGGTPRVFRHDDEGLHEIPYRQDLWNHSPDGPNWGYGGSGPAQLALALCCQVLDDGRALHCYQAFKWGYLARLTVDSWRVTYESLHEAVMFTWTRENDRRPLLNDETDPYEWTGKGDC